MKLIFGAAPSIGSLLIRTLTFSQWSHVGIVYGQEVIEARFPKVRNTSLDSFKAHYPHHAFGRLTLSNEAVAESYVRSRIGKWYDLGGLVGIPFQRDWQRNDRDFCSELPVTAAQFIGDHYFRDAHRVTPEMLWEISK